MRIGNKILPYPVLNQNESNTDYDDIHFEYFLELAENDELIIEENNIVLKNHKIKTNSKYLEHLYNKKIVKFNCLVTCSDTIYRKSFELGLEDNTLYIPIDDLKNKVNISAFAYIDVKDFQYYTDEFKEDYSDLKFKLEKANIIATDDGYSFNIKIDDKKDNKIDSIFTITKNEDKYGYVDYELSENGINIFIDEDVFASYESLKLTSTVQNILFATILVPILSEALNEIKTSNEYENIQDVYNEYNWMLSVANRYEKKFNEKLTLDILKANSSVVLSQKLINSTTNNSILDLEKLLTEEEEIE